MPIRWKTLPIAEVLDRAEGLIEALGPMARVMAEDIEKVRQSQKGVLPQYIDCKLRGLSSELATVFSSAGRAASSIRGDLPADAMARERLGAQLPLITGTFPDLPKKSLVQVKELSYYERYLQEREERERQDRRERAVTQVGLR